MSITENALALVDGETELKTMTRTLGETTFRPGLPIAGRSYAPKETARAVESEVAEKVRELLLAGEPIPADIAAPVLEARLADTLAQARADVITRVLESAASVVSYAEGDEGIEDALSYLRTELDRVLADVRDLAPTFAGVRSAADILDDEDARKDWRILEKLAAEYDEIRTTHLSLFRRAWKSEQPDETLRTSEFEEYGLYADFLDHSREWLKERRAASANSRPGPFRDWLTPTRRDSPLEGVRQLDAPLRILAIVQHSTPWLPNTSQFAAARTAARGAVRAIDGENLQRAESARKQLIAVTTGAATATALPLTPSPSRGKVRRKIPSKFLPESAWAEQQREQLSPSTWGAEQPL